MLLDNILNLLLLKIFILILLQAEANLSTATKRRINSIKSNGESTTSSRFPDILLVIIVLGDNLHIFGDEVSRIETDTKLADH